MTNLYIYIYQHDYIRVVRPVSLFNEIEIRLVRISKCRGAHVCLSNNRKDTSPFCFRFVRMWNSWIFSSAARSSEFTSSSTFYEFVKMKRANPSFPPDVINARENVSSRPWSIHDDLPGNRGSSFRRVPGGLLDSRSNFSLRFLFPLPSFPLLLLFSSREQQDRGERERNFRVVI